MVSHPTMATQTRSSTTTTMPNIKPYLQIIEPRFQDKGFPSGQGSPWHSPSAQGVTREPLKTDGQTDGRADGRTDGQTDGQPERAEIHNGQNWTDNNNNNSNTQQTAALMANVSQNGSGALRV